MASATVNGFALFAGGRTGLEVYYIDNVDVYDPYLTHTKADYLRTPRSDIAATRVENSVLFGGGEKAVKDNNYHDVKGYSDVVEIYRYV